MNVSNLKSGRVQQKAQTRSKILDAAKHLMSSTRSITLDDIAQAANISRATIYRYYSNVDTLLTEASIDIHHKLPAELFEKVKDMSLEGRLIYIQEHYNLQAQRHELAFRRYLSSVLAESINTAKKLRGARRVKSLNLALQPFKKQMSKGDYTKLIAAASILMGIDSLIVCKDVCDLNNDEMDETLKWALKMIIKGMSLEK